MTLIGPLAPSVMTNFKIDEEPTENGFKRTILFLANVGSHQVPFPMCTLETLQKYCSTGSLLLTFC